MLIGLKQPASYFKQTQADGALQGAPGFTATPCELNPPALFLALARCQSGMVVGQGAIEGSGRAAQWRKECHVVVCK